MLVITCIKVEYYMNNYSSNINFKNLINNRNQYNILVYK